MNGPGGLPATMLSWAITYAIHSSLLLGLAALLTRRLVRGDALRETVWRSAFLGSVLTATLVTVLPVQPIAGRLEVPDPAPSVALARSFPATAPAGVEAESRPARHAEPGPAMTPASADPSVITGSASALPWGRILLLAWAATATVLLALLVHRNVRLFRSLEGRRRLAEGPLADLLAELRRWAGVWRPVRLSVSDACPTPLLLGTSEICLPPRFLTDLDEGQQRAALAHELAHVRRRDPLWQLGAAVLNAVLFFQPLNVVARGRLREASEHLCDDWAIRLTGTPLALGMCLTTVASWTTARPLPHLDGTHAMAEGGSPLIERIRRIARGAPGASEVRPTALLSAGLFVLATAVVAPAAGPSPAGSAGPDAGGSAIGPTVGSAGRQVASNDTLETVQLLEELAMRDASARVRQEAVDGLTGIPHPAAAAALMRIARRATHPDIRAEAVQKLDEFPTDDVVAVLLEVVREDSVGGVRSDALDVLDDFDLDAARAALRRLAREHPLPDIRQAAVAALSDGG